MEKSHTAPVPGAYTPFFITLVALVSLVKISLVSSWPTLTRMAERHDSAHFVKQAISILDGRWLGTLDHVTLAKGPMTPLWLAASHLLGWPFHFTRELLYLLGCLLALKAVYMINRNRWLAFLSFSFLMYFPTASNYAPFAALYRSALQQPLVLIIQVSLIIVSVRLWQDRAARWGEILILGIALSAFLLNREEWVWLLPQLFWLGACAVIWLTFANEKKGLFLPLLKIVLLPGALVALSISGISYLNAKYYGIHTLVEVKHPAYQHAYKNFLRIKPDVPVDSARLTPDVLKKLEQLHYGKEIVRDPLNSGHTNAVRLPWSFRSAVNRAGYYEHGARGALDYYQKLGDEINEACEKERFACRNVIFTIIPIFEGYWQRVGEKSLEILNDFYQFDDNRYNWKDTPSRADYRYRLNTSFLIHSNPGLTRSDIESKINPFYLRWATEKIHVLESINAAYRLVWPAILLITGIMAIWLFTLAVCQKTFKLEAIIVTGILVSLGTQLAMFSLLWASGVSSTSRLFFNTYPLLALVFLICVITLASKRHTYSVP